MRGRKVKYVDASELSPEARDKLVRYYKVVYTNHPGEISTKYKVPNLEGMPDAALDWYEESREERDKAKERISEIEAQIEKLRMEAQELADRHTLEIDLHNNKYQGDPLSSDAVKMDLLDAEWVGFLMDADHWETGYWRPSEY